MCKKREHVVRESYDLQMLSARQNLGRGAMKAVMPADGEQHSCWAKLSTWRVHYCRVRDASPRYYVQLLLPSGI